MLTLLSIMLFASPEPPPLAALFPCPVGQTRRYQVWRDKKATQQWVTERFLRQERKDDGVICWIQREVGVGAKTQNASTYGIKVGKQTVWYVGEPERPVARETPLLKSPLRVGARWVFDRVLYKVTAIRPQVVVVEKSDDGRHQAERRYAPGLGLVGQRDANGALRLDVSKR